MSAMIRRGTCVVVEGRVGDDCAELERLLRDVSAMIAGNWSGC